MKRGQVKFYPYHKKKGGGAQNVLAMLTGCNAEHLNFSHAEGGGGRHKECPLF